MGKKIERLFLIGNLSLTIVYGLLEVLYIYLMCAGGDFYADYEVPFAVGWLLQVEWLLPFLLCLMCSFFLMKQKEMYFLAAVLTAGGVWTVCTHEFGVSFFTGIPIYFKVWLIGSALSVLLIPLIATYCAKGKIAKSVLMGVLFVFAASGGVEFYDMYEGLYLIFHIVRCVLVLIEVAFAIYCLWMKKGDETLEVQEKKTKTLVPFTIGMIIGGLWIVWLLVEMLYVRFMHEYRIENWHIEHAFTALLLCMPYLLAITTSIYVVKGKKNLGTVGLGIGMLCVFLCANNIAIRYGGIEVPTVGRVAMWIFVLFLLFDYLCQESKIAKIIFTLLIYTAADVSVQISVQRLIGDDTLPQICALQIISSLIAVGVTIFTIVKAEAEQKEKFNWRGLILWVLIGLYGICEMMDVTIFTHFNCLRLLEDYFAFMKGKIYSVADAIWQYADYRNSVEIVHWFALFAVLTCMARAMKKKGLFLFSSGITIVSMYGITFTKPWNVFGEKWYSMVPVVMVLIVIMILCIPILKQIFPTKERWFGIVFAIMTYGMIFYQYVFPIFKKETFERIGVERYYFGLYLVIQIILFALTGITIVFYLRGERIRKEERNMWV